MDKWEYLLDFLENRAIDRLRRAHSSPTGSYERLMELNQCIGLLEAMNEMAKLEQEREE